MLVRVPSNGAALLPVVAPQDSLGVLFFAFVLLGFCIARPMALRGSRCFSLLCCGCVVVVVLVVPKDGVDGADCCDDGGDDDAPCMGTQSGSLGQ